MQGSGFRVQGLGFRVRGSVQGLGFMVYGLKYSVWFYRGDLGGILYTFDLLQPYSTPGIPVIKLLAKSPCRFMQGLRLEP